MKAFSCIPKFKKHWCAELSPNPEPVSGVSAVLAVSAASSNSTMNPNSRSKILITFLEPAPAELLPEGLEEAPAREAHDEDSPFATSNAERFTAVECGSDLAVDRNQ